MNKGTNMFAALLCFIVALSTGHELIGLFALVFVLLWTGGNDDF